VRQMIRGRKVVPVGCGAGGPVAVRVTHRLLDVSQTELRLRFRQLPDLRREIHWPGTLTLKLPLLGRTHATNAGLATAAALLLGVQPETVSRARASFPPPERRLEVVHRGRFTVLDDTASHPEALNVVFEVARALPHKRLHIAVAVRGKRGDKLNAQFAES